MNSCKAVGDSFGWVSLISFSLISFSLISFSLISFSLISFFWTSFSFVSAVVSVVGLGKIFSLKEEILKSLTSLVSSLALLFSKWFFKAILIFSPLPKTPSTILFTILNRSLKSSLSLLVAKDSQVKVLVWLSKSMKRIFFSNTAPNS